MNNTVKSYVKTMTYAKKDGSVEERKVFVMNENDDYIRGLDFKYLNADQQKKVTEVLADHNVSNEIVFGKVKGAEIEGFDKDWSIAWRTFTKSNIQKQ